jgi:hypothetical protein
VWNVRRNLMMISGSCVRITELISALDMVRQQNARARDTEGLRARIDVEGYFVFLCVLHPAWT